MQALVTCLVLLAANQPPAVPPKAEGIKLAGPITITDLENPVITLTGNGSNKVTFETVKTPNGNRIRIVTETITIEATRLKLSLPMADGRTLVQTLWIGENGKMWIDAKTEATPPKPAPPKQR